MIELETLNNSCIHNVILSGTVTKLYYNMKNAITLRVDYTALELISAETKIAACIVQYARRSHNMFH